MNRLLRTNLFVFCFIILYFALSFSIGFISALLPENAHASLWTSLLIYLLSFGIPALVYALIAKRKNNQRLADFFSFHRLPLVSILLVIAAAITVQPLMMLISSISQLFFRNITTSSMLQMAEMPLWAFLISSAVLPAFFEELICRGTIFNGYQDTPTWYALFIPALFFGMLHLNFQQSLYAIAGGIFFALLVKATGSLWSSIIAHLTINGLQSLFAWYMLQSGAYDSAAALELPTGWMGMLLALIPYIFLTAITLPLLILCLRQLFIRHRKPEQTLRPLWPYWHQGAWVMYAVIGFLLLYTIATEIMIRLLP